MQEISTMDQDAATEGSGRGTVLKDKMFIFKLFSYWTFPKVNVVGCFSRISERERVKSASLKQRMGTIESISFPPIPF